MTPVDASTVSTGAATTPLLLPEQQHLLSIQAYLDPSNALSASLLPVEIASIHPSSHRTLVRKSFRVEVEQSSTCTSDYSAPPTPQKLFYYNSSSPSDQERALLPSLHPMGFVNNAPSPSDATTRLRECIVCKSTAYGICDQHTFFVRIPV